MAHISKQTGEEKEPIMKTTLQLLILGVTFSAAAMDDGFAPYQTIIDRNPFGCASGNAAQATAANARGADGTDISEAASNPELEKEIERLRASVRVCAVNAPPDAEPVVGFTDTTQNPPKNYLLTQGQTKDGWTVVSIDAASRQTVLSHGGVTVPLYLGTTANLTTKKP